MQGVFDREEYPSAEQWAKAAGVSGTTITRFLDKDDSPIPTARTLAKLSAVVSMPYRGGIIGLPPLMPERKGESSVNGGDSVLSSQTKFETHPIQPLPVESAGLPPLPILGNARGGMEGFFLDNGHIQDTTPRPPILAGNRDAFAIYVVGDSMEPRYMQGELAYIDPIKPVRPGDFVLVELSDHQGFIKQLVRRTADVVILRQFNPRRDMEIPKAQILRLYRIVGAVEG